MHIKPVKAGMAVGGFAAIAHAVWALIIGLGWGQSFLNFIYRIHMVSPAPQAEPFDLATALLLVIVAAVIGFVAGSVFARVWNSVGSA